MGSRKKSFPNHPRNSFFSTRQDHISVHCARLRQGHRPRRRQSRLAWHLLQVRRLRAQGVKLPCTKPLLEYVCVNIQWTTDMRLTYSQLAWMKSRRRCPSQIKSSTVVIGSKHKSLKVQINDGLKSCHVQTHIPHLEYNNESPVFVLSAQSTRSWTD